MTHQWTTGAACCAAPAGHPSGCSSSAPAESHCPVDMAVHFSIHCISQHCTTPPHLTIHTTPPTAHLTHHATPLHTTLLYHTLSHYTTPSIPHLSTPHHSTHTCMSTKLTDLGLTAILWWLFVSVGTTTLIFLGPLNPSKLVSCNTDQHKLVMQEPMAFT